MRVLILHHELSPSAGAEDRDVLDQAAAVAEALAALGHHPLVAAAAPTLDELRRQLRRLSPRVVFNLVESFQGSDRNQFQVAALLEEMGLPFTGNPSRALFTTGDKRLTKVLLHRAGLPTPQWLSAGSPDADRAGQGPGVEELLKTFDDLGRPGRPGSWPGRYLLQSAWTHASAGMLETLQTVTVPHEAEMLCRLAEEQSRRTRQPWFAEEYIEGREFNLSLLGSGDHCEVLPPAEIDFSQFGPERLRIVGYRAKWVPESFEYRATPRRFEFPPQDRPLLERLCELARRCWQLFGLAGYARVDFRVGETGEPQILEVNTNPCLSPDAGFAAAVARAGWTFPQLVATLLEDALRRCPGPGNGPRV